MLEHAHSVAPFLLHDTVNSSALVMCALNGRTASNARLGRFGNLPHTSAVYLADCPATALLEVLVHFELSMDELP
ncbi:hypothetical protein FGL86_09880 [Pistricoccus aurantiacus]|uniref:RES domain-containing protein n=1 Tax=Pistricoccus aurantiacus TaxID=1883414 RepID=A0A5B8SV11_9GAMM|nr:hypothetical protein FGL86_09880 [Pistricoccus aurantiacus]